ncbi:MAG: DUF1631 family protein [Hahellaceae bacterium]|nr:DUF1631 family protein [Hahellaceae bacterium]MCP5169683.1 DUF1631 family protein [Hahellaceae bacterium]
MERRNFERVAFVHDAIMVFAGREWSCRVRDFCPGGVFIEFHGAQIPPLSGDAAFVSGEQVIIKMACEWRGKQVPVMFTGEARHRVAEAVGIRFLEIDERTLGILKTKSGYQRSATRSPSSAAPTPEVDTSLSHEMVARKENAEKLLHAYRRLILEKMPVVIECCLKEVNARLLSSANEARDNWLRADFSLSMQMLDRRNHWISEQVSRAVVHAMSESPEVTTRSPSSEGLNQASVESLSIVEKNDFEDWLAMQMAIRLIENALGLDLGRLCLVFSQLRKTTYEPNTLAVGPAVILKALQRCLGVMQLPATGYPVVFKVVGKRLNTELRDIYAVMLSLAERAGFHADLAPKAAVLSYQPVVRSPARTKTNDSSASGMTNTSSPTSEPVLPTTSSATEGQYQDGAVDALSADLASNPLMASSEGHDSEALLTESLTTEAQTYKTLQSLIRLKSAVAGGKTLASEKSKGGDKVSLGNIVTFGREQLIGAIEVLQKTDKQSDASPRYVSMKQSVVDQLQLAQGEHGRLRDRDNELIDITDRLFETILEQLGVNEVVKKWLKKLKLSILKVVLLDDTFFSNQNHPARQVINQLARLGAVRRYTNTSLDRSLESFADRIISEYQGDPHLFEEILHELNVLIERQEKAFERNAERIARAYEGQQKLTEARNKVREALNDRLAGLNVPKLLLALLDQGGLRQFLVVTLLRESDKSSLWQESLTAIDQLMAWLADSADGASLLSESIERELEAPTLLASIDRELVASGQTGHKEILKKLQSCLLDGKKAALEFVAQYDWPDEVSEDQRYCVIKPEQHAGPKETTRWHRRARQMTIGDWIELQREGQKQRLRLAWTGSDSFRFVFVDSHGLKDVDISLDDIAKYIEQGDLTVLDKQEVPLVDQGLHQMVQSVYEELANQASCDPLTGLLNRQAFERSLDRAVADAVAHKKTFVLCYIDIDQFKVLNNTYGHVAGDALLKQVARVIRLGAPSLVTCGRLGGNEFGVIFAQADIERAAKIAEALRTQIASAPFIWAENDIQVTVSIGLAEVDVSMDTHDTLMRKANSACSLAKQHGRNRLLCYTPQDRDQALHNEMASWIKRMDRSLEDFILIRAQEIAAVDTASGRLPHYEILIGVRDEAGNILSPVAFIEAAEHFGRMPKVDRYVVHSVLRWLDDNPQRAAKMHGVSINLSGTSMNDESFLSFVLGELASCSVEKEKICFEITETAAVTSLSDASDFMKQIKKTGCKFSLDDFGTGLSSYAYIQKLPIDYIKIDGVFIKNIVNNQKDQALVRSINELAHFMGLETIAEFVENEEILAMLRDIGVDYAQGYGIHKPAPLATLADHSI